MKAQKYPINPVIIKDLWDLVASIINIIYILCFGSFTVLTNFKIADTKIPTMTTAVIVSIYNRIEEANKTVVKGGFFMSSHDNSKEQVNTEWADMFRDIQEFYNESMEEVNEELNCILSEPESECSEADAPEYIESAIAESHNKILAAAISDVMGVLGKQIASTVSAYDNDDNYIGRTDFRKGDHLCVNSPLKSYHAIYAGCGKVVYYSKGYELFPEIKVVPLSFFARKGSVSYIEESSAGYSPDMIVRRAMSRLGDSDFKNSESFVKWCIHQ